MSGINMDKMKEKLADLKGEGGDGGSIFWKPEINQKHRIRLLLPDDGTGDPFKEFWLHYGVANEPGFLCPKRNYNEQCDICEFASEVYQEGKSKDSEHHMNLAKDLWPTQRFYTPVIERGEEEEGPKWYSYSKTVQEDFLAYALDPEYGDPTDPMEGHDVKLQKSKSENDRFPSTSIDLSPSQTPLAESDEKVRELISSIPDLESELFTRSKEEINEALEAHMRQENEGIEEDNEVEKYGEGDDLEKKMEELKNQD